MANRKSVYQCFNCLQNIYFKHSQTNYISCHNCATQYHRDKEDNLTIISGFELKTSNEVLKIGTTGNWNNSFFTITGRVRIWMEDNVVNYWTILFKDGTFKYLVESYGLYKILSKKDIQANDLIGIESVELGRSKKIDKKLDFFLTKKLRILKYEMEGELIWENVKPNNLILHFSSKTGSLIEVHKHTNNSINVYDAFFLSFQELQFNEINTIFNHDKKFSCVKCHNSITSIAWPYTQSFSCKTCRTTYELNNEGTLNKREISTKEAKFELELGTKFNFNNTEYDLIGCIQKQEQSSYKTKWKEYILFNKYEGFATLSEYNGNWTFIVEKGNAPLLENPNERSFVYGTDEFNLFQKYSSRVVASIGEFPYNISTIEKIQVSEFINPPEMWLVEKTKTESINWFYGRHVSKKIIKENFKVSLPWKNSIGAIEPKLSFSYRHLVLTTLVFVFASLVIHMLLAMNNEQKLILNEKYIMPDSSTVVKTVTEKFVLSKWKTNMEFDIYAPVSNSWFELSATLINVKTGAEFSIEQGIEYYSGYSDGEYWTEGSYNEKAYLSSIPAGTYFLQIHGVSDQINKVQYFNLEVKVDTPMQRNMWLIILIILALATSMGLLKRYFERERWRESNFSPYTYA